jgi:PIN domain nuclease of toxin-antitoxin system
MKLLFDSHALIWYFKGDTNLSESAKLAIEDIKNIRYASSASFWEIAIKVSLGKIQLDYPFPALKKLVLDLGLQILPIEFEHTVQASILPLHHRDPFDRMLVAQALTDNLTIVSKDPNIPFYGVETVW